MLVPLVLMAMATMARAFVVMMLMPTFTLRSLMIVAVGHLWPTTITVHFAAKRLLGVLALAATAAAFGTAGTGVSRRSHCAVSRATSATTATAATTTPSTTPATRLAIPVSTVATARSITAAVLTFYASVTRATRQRSR
jgi:hypothetical protein